MSTFGKMPVTTPATMKPGSPDPDPQLWWNARWLIMPAALLALVAVLGWMTDTPVRSLFPYGIAVGVVSWHHGMKAGFVFAGLGTLAALATGAFPSHEGLRGQELGEGLYTYLKLSAVVVGVTLGKRARYR